MDPWCTNNSTSNVNLSHDSFEDNFKPSVSESLPDSQQYLEILGKYKYKLSQTLRIFHVKCFREQIAKVKERP